MGKLPLERKAIGTLIAAASGASIPFGSADAQAIPPLFPQGTTVSVEGGVAFSHYWATTFPGNPASLLPAINASSTSSSDKVGLPPPFFVPPPPPQPISIGSPSATAPLQSSHNTGGYGSFSIAHNIDRTLDWRFSAAFYEFGSTTSSAAASQSFSVGPLALTNTAYIAENDRFGLELADFDFGRHSTQGITQFRAFAGLRALHTHEGFDTFTATEGTAAAVNTAIDKIGCITFPDCPLETTITTTTTITDSATYATGSSHFTGVGPRIGLDFFAGSIWGVVGSVSGAIIPGLRSSSFGQLTSVTINGVPAQALNFGFSQNRADWVGNLEAMVGIAWQFSPGGQLVLGYRVDEWYNIRESFSFAGFGNKRDVLTQNPFLKVSFRY